MRRQQYVFDYVEQQLVQRFGLKTVENGGLKVYTTIDLQMQQEARIAIDSHAGRAGARQPAGGRARRPSTRTNGHILAMASSATYDQTKFDYPVQAHRQPGSAFKVFALMTLIHDYDGDPNQTYYTSKFLPAGWLLGGPDLVGAHGRGDLPGERSTSPRRRWSPTTRCSRSSPSDLG